MKMIERYFKGYEWAFAMYDKKQQEMILEKGPLLHKMVSPCSTFKIPHALFALKAQVISINDSEVKWDGTAYPYPSWERDQNLKSAIGHSVVWYFQEMAQRIGLGHMKWMLKQYNYGNQEIGGQLQHFWLYPNALKATPIGQLAFLNKFFLGELPDTPDEYIKHVQDCLVIEDTHYRLSGKTGSGMNDGQWRLGWFVGRLEALGQDYLWVTLIRGKAHASGRNALAISRSIFKDMGLFS